MCVGVVTLSNLFDRGPNWLWYKVSIRFRLIGNHSIHTWDNLRANKDPVLVEGICLIQILNSKLLNGHLIFYVKGGLPIGNEFATSSTFLWSKSCGFSVFRIGVHPHVNWGGK